MGNFTYYVAHDDTIVALGIIASIISLVALIAGVVWASIKVIQPILTKGWQIARFKRRKSLTIASRRCYKSPSYYIATLSMSVILAIAVCYLAYLSNCLLYVYLSLPRAKNLFVDNFIILGGMANQCLPIVAGFLVISRFVAIGRRVRKIAVRENRKDFPESLIWRRFDKAK